MVWKQHTPDRVVDGVFNVETSEGLAPARHYTSPAATQLASLVLQIVDLTQARACLVELTSRLDVKTDDAVWDDVERGLFEAAIFAYWRCFDPTGGNQLRLDAKRLFPTEELGAYAHEHVRLTRNTHYAHDVSGLRDTVVAVVADEKKYRISVPSMRTDPPLNLVRDLGTLIEVALSFCNARRLEALIAVDGEINALGFERISKLPQVGFRSPNSAPHTSRRQKGQKPFHPRA